MQPEKLKITNHNPKEGEDKEFNVLFNPAEYTFESSTKWKENEVIGQVPWLQYTGGTVKKLSMELFLDTYETKKDVREHTAKFASLLVPRPIGTSNRPPKLELSCGSANPQSGFPFVCVLASLKEQFVLFSSDGKPVRAKLSVSFTQYREPPKAEMENPQNHSSPAQTYTVRARDTLAGIANTVWQDPTQWRLIADQNGIDNPRILTPGMTMAIPAVQ